MCICRCESAYDYISSIVFANTQLNIKPVLIKTIQFSVSTVLMSKTVQIKKFSPAEILSLNVKTVLIKTIQFNLST